MKGRKTKLTKQTSQTICDSIRQGFTEGVAAVRGGIERSTLYDWLRKGRDAKRGLHADFYRAFLDAKVYFEMLATRTIRNGMLGGFRQVPCYDADEKLIPELDPRTGQPLRDESGRPLFKMEWAHQRADHIFAAKILAKRNPQDWGDGVKPSLDEELDRISKEMNSQLPSHRTIGIPLLTKAVQILVDQGVDIDVPDEQLDKLVARQLERRRTAALAASSEDSAKTCGPNANIPLAALPAPANANDESKLAGLPDEHVEKVVVREPQPPPMAALAAPSFDATENGSHPGSSTAAAGLPLPNGAKDESRHGATKLE
jgi:hypothetical protein